MAFNIKRFGILLFLALGMSALVLGALSTQSSSNLRNINRVIAAHFGDADAQQRLSLDYMRGRMGPIDTDKGVYWFYKAAEQGNYKAQHDLAYWYSYDPLNKGLRDLEKAEYWYRKATEKNYGKSIYNLGYMLYGRGEIEEGVALIQKAAELNDKEAMHMWARWHSYEDSNPDKNMKLAEYWYQKAAEAGNAKSMFNLGYIRNEEKEYMRAIEWFQKSYNAGLNVGAHGIGRIYFKDAEELRDYNEALKWYKLAYDAGYKKSSLDIALIYKNLYPDDHEKISLWLKNAADTGIPEFEYQAAKTYMKHSVNQNTHDWEKFLASASWLNRAAKKDHSKSKDLLKRSKNLCRKIDYMYILYGCAIAAQTDDEYAKAVIDFLNDESEEMSEGEKYLLRQALDDDAQAQLFLVNLYRLMLNKGDAEFQDEKYFYLWHRVFMKNKDPSKSLIDEAVLQEITQETAPMVADIRADLDLEGLAEMNGCIGFFGLNHKAFLECVGYNF